MKKQNKKNKIMKLSIFAIVLIFIYLAVFLIPQQTKILSLNPAKITLEPWRFLTYQFSHASTSHLIENLLGIFFVVWIAYELQVAQFMFSITYLGAGFLAILPLWFIKPFVALGSSTAIISALTISFFNSKKYKIKPYVLIILLSVTLFSQTLFALIMRTKLELNLLRDSAHFTGVLFGIAIYYPLKHAYKIKTKKKRTILQNIKN